MLCQNKQKNEMLPQTNDSLLQHIKQSNHQAFGRSHALKAMQDLESPERHGWTKDRELLVPLPITKAPMKIVFISLLQAK